MERNVMGELNMHRAAGTKPNFSDIARRHGLDRHTVAKYWKGGGEVEDRRSDRESAFERVRAVVEAKAVLPGATKKGVHEMLLHKHNDPPLPGYGAFTAWCRRQGIAFGRAASPEPHPLYETPPGRQLQFDWKEDMRLADANGEVFEFNVWNGTLGYSRRHRFIPTLTRTADDLMACLLDAFVTFGGIPDQGLTDNMSALVAFSGGRRRKVGRVWRFAEEAGFEIVLLFFTTTKFRISRLISFGFHRFAKVPHPFFANCPIFPSSRLPRTFCSARRTQPADHDA